MTITRTQAVIGTSALLKKEIKKSGLYTVRRNTTRIINRRSVRSLSLLSTYRVWKYACVRMSVARTTGTLVFTNIRSNEYTLPSTLKPLIIRSLRFILNRRWNWSPWFPDSKKVSRQLFEQCRGLVDSVEYSWKRQVSKYPARVVYARKVGVMVDERRASRV